MDIECRNAAGHFSLRAAALIFRGDRLLLAKSDRHDCFYTVGSGIRQGETSGQAVIRECLEETGHRFEVDRLVFVQERFYRAEGADHHEIVFFYLMKDTGFDIRGGTATDQQSEHLHWIPADDLAELNVVPAFLRTALRSLPDQPVHVISHE